MPLALRGLFLLSCLLAHHINAKVISLMALACTSQSMAMVEGGLNPSCS
ncbi:hypothetical protein EV13_1968 [Prochlorococcus sp. MIT 0702]|nr:hypothetical protein EV13_1968 [Prochlorococcus sp. MIT 0702]